MRSARGGGTPAISPWSSDIGGGVYRHPLGAPIGADAQGGRDTAMEVPLTPLDFARRTRRLHGRRPAVVDGDLRLTYEELLDRCDHASAALERLGVARGDRVAVIAPNTHAHLEQYYAVPQLGAVLVPVNFRLTGDDWAYIVGHSGARVVVAHSDQLDAIDAVRSQMPGVQHF